MNVSFVQPEQHLAPYVAFIWVFESTSGVPMADSRIIVPDGRAKIILPFGNALCAAVNQSVLTATEHQIFLIGIQRSAATIGSTATNTRTIGMELTPKGLYHFFKLNMYELTDRMLSFEELFGPWGVRLQNRVGEVDSPEEKIALLQAGLTERLQQNQKEYVLLDHAVDLIAQAHGMLTIRELAGQVGYSKRHLDVLFKDHVGLSPKALASILRFQECYQVLTRQPSPISLRNSLSAYYYDQAHFIKEFKRYSGFTPRRYQELPNEFGNAFTAPH